MRVQETSGTSSLFKDVSKTCDLPWFIEHRLVLPARCKEKHLRSHFGWYHISIRIQQCGNLHAPRNSPNLWTVNSTQCFGRNQAPGGSWLKTCSKKCSESQGESRSVQTQQKDEEEKRDIPGATEEMCEQLSVQIAKEIIKPAKQRKNLRQNFLTYQNVLNIMDTAGFWKMSSASSVIRCFNKQLPNAQPQEGSEVYQLRLGAQGRSHRSCESPWQGVGARTAPDTRITLTPCRSSSAPEGFVHPAQVCPEGRFPNGYI